MNKTKELTQIKKFHLKKENGLSINLLQNNKDRIIKNPNEILQNNKESK